MNKKRQSLNAHCATLPGAELTDPWGGGHDCWKVGDKMFVLMGVKDAGVSIKCGDVGEASMLIEQGIVERAPYLSRGGWVLVRWEMMDEEEICRRATRSYLTVRRTLPRRVRDKLGSEPSI